MVKLHLEVRLWVANFTVTVPAGVNTVWREGKGSALGYCPFCWGKVTQPRSGPCIQEHKSGMINITWVILSLQGLRWDHCLTKVLAEGNLLFSFWWEQRGAQNCGFFFFPVLLTSGILSSCKCKFCWREALSSSSKSNFKRTHLLSIQFKKVQQFVTGRWVIHCLDSLYAPNVITLSNLPGFSFFLGAVALLISCFLIPLLHKPYL